VLQIADLLLGAGGFGVVVVYLSGLPAKRRSVPWPRFQQRCQKANTTLLLVSDEPLAGSFTAATVVLEAAGAHWERVPGDRAVLVGQSVRLRLVHSRLGPTGDLGVVELRK
jgi:hypothetical protein